MVKTLIILLFFSWCIVCFTWALNRLWDMIRFRYFDGDEFMDCLCILSLLGLIGYLLYDFTVCLEAERALYLASAGV